MHLIDLNQKAKHRELNLHERDLSRIFYRNWSKIFPDLKLIQKEFTLQGEVRAKQTSGRIDFFAFNPSEKRFVVIELKVEYDKNIRNQIFDYVDFIEDNLDFIIMQSKKIISDININTKKPIELILISKYFKTNDYKRAKSIKYPIKLIKYRLFKNYSLILEEFNNINVEKENKLEISNNSHKKEESSYELVKFWEKFMELKDKQIININEDYKIEGPELIIGLGKIYQKYINEQKLIENDYYSLNHLRNQLISTDAFNGRIKSVRFGKTVTSGYIFDKQKIFDKFG
ncbi:MAG: hypothetical protein K9I74_00550 [Bacteroidales bacterium]|nr:hypothetical protein [Bacteroidales bacterium]